MLFFVVHQPNPETRVRRILYFTRTTQASAPSLPSATAVDSRPCSGTMLPAAMSR